MKTILLVYYLLLPNSQVQRNAVELVAGTTLEDCHQMLDRYSYTPPAFIDGSIFIGGYCQEKFK